MKTVIETGLASEAGRVPFPACSIWKACDPPLVLSLELILHSLDLRYVLLTHQHCLFLGDWVLKRPHLIQHPANLAWVPLAVPLLREPVWIESADYKTQERLSTPSTRWRQEGCVVVNKAY